MSLSKEQQQTFKSTWANKPSVQVTEELASICMETRRIPDYYLFEYNSSGKLISPETSRLIEESIERESFLGKLEYQGFQFIERTGQQNKSGIIIWISPPHPLRSESTKVVVSKIIGKDPNNILENRALILDMSEKECLDLANALNEDFVYLHASHLRRQPIFLQGADFDWSVFRDARQIEMVMNSNDLRAKQEFLFKAAILARNISNADLTDIIGSFDISCPSQTAFEFFFQQSRIVKKMTLVKNCGACKRELNKYMRRHDKCPYCNGEYLCA